MSMTDITTPDSARIDWDENGHLEVLTFSLHEESFAIEAMLVREIIDLLPETSVPGARRLVGSVANFRGKVIPIADLRLAFGMPKAEATPDSRIIVIELLLDDEPTLIGIRTDKVHEVATFDRDSSEAPPAVGLSWRRNFIRSLVRRPQGVTVLPDLTAILSAGSETGAAVPHLQPA